jgi:hypothetical protein
MFLIHPVWDGGTDGRDAKVIAYFTHKEDAEIIARGKGCMGVGNGETTPPLVVYTSLTDYCDSNPDALKAKALAKLTEEEKKILGLS